MSEFFGAEFGLVLVFLGPRLDVLLILMGVGDFD